MTYSLTYSLTHSLTSWKQEMLAHLKMHLPFIILKIQSSPARYKVLKYFPLFWCSLLFSGVSCCSCCFFVVSLLFTLFPWYSCWSSITSFFFTMYHSIWPDRLLISRYEVGLNCWNLVIAAFHTNVSPDKLLIHCLETLNWPKALMRCLGVTTSFISCLQVLQSEVWSPWKCNCESGRLGFLR